MSNITVYTYVLQFKMKYGESTCYPQRGLHNSRANRCGRCYHNLARSCVLHESVMNHPLVATHALISDQVSPREVSIILTHLDTLIHRGCRGSVVEFGCFSGTTSLFIRRLLDERMHNAPFHVYDSFEGLPEKTINDMSVAGDQFRAGELHATKKQFLYNFYKAGLVPPVVHKAWFRDLSVDDVPDDIMFAFLDGDYYESIRDSLRIITPKLAAGAVVIVDDYANEALPGAARAVDEWIRGRDVSLRVEASLAVISGL